MNLIQNPKTWLFLLGLFLLSFFYLSPKIFLFSKAENKFIPLKATNAVHLPMVLNPSLKAPGFVAPDYGVSSYEIPVTLPACDEDALIINDDIDLNQINWQANDVFCLLPGNYTAWGELLIEDVSGTANQPKVLRFYDPQDASPPHPVHRADSFGLEAVILQFHLKNSNYWILDGLTIRNSPQDNRLTDASHNLFNRLLIEGGDAVFLRIVRDSDANIVQNNVLRNQSSLALKNDEVCILLYTQDWDEIGLEIENSRIVKNEIYNCNDGIGLLKDSNNRPAYYPGTVVADNDIYITDELYTDCRGNPDANGACACAENAIDIKATIHEKDLNQAETWVRLINNRFWGFRPTDDTKDGQGNRLCASGSLGRAISSHFDARGLVIQGNIIMDSPIAISGGGALESNPPNTNHLIVNNLIYNIHDCYDQDKQGIRQYHILDQGQFVHCVDENNNRTEDRGKGLSTTKNDAGPKHYGNTHFGNTLIDVGDTVNTTGWWAYIQDADHSFECNTIINASGKDYYTSHETNTADKNAYYNSVPYCPMSAPCDAQHLIDEPNANSANQAPFTFFWKLWTGPEQVTIPYALHTASTPSFGIGAACWIDDPEHPWN